MTVAQKLEKLESKLQQVRKHRKALMVKFGGQDTLKKLNSIFK